MKITKNWVYKNSIPLLYLVRYNIDISSLKSFENSLMQLKNTHSLYTLARVCIQRSYLKSQIDSLKYGNSN